MYLVLDICSLCAASHEPPHPLRQPPDGGLLEAEETRGPDDEAGARDGEGRGEAGRGEDLHVSRVTSHVYRHESPHLDGVGDHDVGDADEAYHHGAGQLDGLVQEEQGADP